MKIFIIRDLENENFQLIQRITSILEDLKLMEPPLDNIQISDIKEYI
ncbi:hypothetical protein pb186bvf_004982 [Paramecium bursaria]